MNYILGISEIKKDLTWQEAMDYATSLGEDWVLPDMWQLETIYRAFKLGHPDLQDMKGRGFWSSSVWRYYAGYAWIVSFRDGSLDNGDKSEHCYLTRYIHLDWIADLVVWVINEEKKNVRTI